MTPDSAKTNGMPRKVATSPPKIGPAIEPTCCAAKRSPKIRPLQEGGVFLASVALMEG